MGRRDRLPGRDRAVERIDELTGGGRRPAVYLVEVADLAGLAEADGPGTSAALDELVDRLDRLVRSSDLLALDDDGRFVLVGAEVSPEAAGSLMERIEGVAALPVEIGGLALALRVHVGAAFASPDDRAQDVLDRAADDLRRRRAP